MNFTHVFQPIRIGPLTARNRIEVSPAEPFLCTKEGLVTEEFVAFTAAMAKGGAGIVTVGDSPVTQAYADENHYVVNLADPFVVHGLVRVSDAIHRYGALASIELNLRDERLPADYSHEELQGIIRAFADAAERCRKGGFDMVMLHGGHGHSVSQFYSPFFNKRTDEYGAQTFENRCRFADELLDAVRERIGRDMAIEWRMSGDELIPEGVGIEEGLAFARHIQSKIDLIHISAGNMYDVRTMSRIIQPAYMPLATNLHIAARYKQELEIPVTAVGSMNMELAEQALAEGKADVVAMIRAFIADPEQVNKARQGRADEIRPCIRCNVCTGDDPHGCPKPLRCTVNPVSGRNPLFDVIEKAERPKKVAVIGAGAAGMEAARRLVERGHSVVLYDKKNELGGSLTVAGANSLKGDVRRYAEWSVHMTKKTPGIELRLGQAVLPEDLAQEAPEAIVVAVGGSQIIPNVPGVRGDNVVLAADVDTGEAKVGHRVVLVGAGLTGSGTALALAREGHEVTVIDMQPLEALYAQDREIRSIHEMARKEGVTILGGARLAEIRPDALVAETAEGTRTFPCDSVALSLGVRPNAALAERFRSVCDEVYIVGDCRKVGNITSAVREGFYAAMNI